MKDLWTVLLVLLLSPLDAVSYKNPLMEPSGGADPAILHHEGTYYLYTTNAAGSVFLSTDLVNWERGPQVIPDHLKGAWAPEGYHHPEDGRFYLYYTYRYKIGVAVSDRPDGPFEDLGFLVIPGIDAHPFRDDDGRLYLYFTHTPDFTMYAIPMFTPTEPGGPATRCFEVSADWERLGHAVNEGPWMLKQDGTYYLFYSGGSGQTRHYSIGYATAPTPLGPFTKFRGNPVITGTESLYGPAHGSFTMDQTGQWWHLYHQKTDPEVSWRRFVCIDPLDYHPETGTFSGVPTKGVERAGPVLEAERVWIPEISPRGAYFYEQVEITLACRTADAAIHYTLDGSEPGPDSPLYEGPIQLDRSALVKARAIREGMKTSGVARMRFVRTNFQSPEAPFTHYPTGNPPFLLYPSPAAEAPPPRDWD